MARTINGNYIGRAAWLNKSEIQAEIFEMQERTREIEKAQVVDICTAIRDCLPLEEYVAWWNETPGDNAGFRSAAEAKLFELMGVDPSETEAQHKVDLYCNMYAGVN